MKKLALFLAIISVVSTFAACKGNNKNKTETTNGTKNTASSEEDIKDGIPDDLNFDGAKVNFLVRTGNYLEWKDEMFAPESSVDIVSSSINKRNKIVEDRLGVKFNFTERDGDYSARNLFLNTVANSVNTGGEDALHLVGGYAAHMTALSSSGMLYNLKEVNYLDFEKPWWSGGFNEQLTLNGKMFLAFGDIGNSMLKCMSVVFFNKQMAEDYGYSSEQFYDAVRNKEWTIDYIGNVCKTVHKNLDEDSTMDGLLDEFGYYSNNQCDNWLSFGINIISKTDTEASIDFDIDKYSMALDKFNTFSNKNDGVIPLSKAVYYKEMIPRFMNDHILFFHHRLANAESFRGMESDFGILPSFMLDDNQEDYITPVAYNATGFCIPSNCNNLDMAGAVLEALCSQSYFTTTKVYYETAIGLKYARDDTFPEMLDIIRKGATITFEALYFQDFEGLYEIPGDFVSANSSDIASYVDARKASWDNAIEKINDYFEYYE